jgi:hypothetical protein
MGLLPDVSHGLMTVSRQFAHIMIHVLVNVRIQRYMSESIYAAVRAHRKNDEKSPRSAAAVIFLQSRGNT